MKKTLMIIILGFMKEKTSSTNKKIFKLIKYIFSYINIVKHEKRN